MKVILVIIAKSINPLPFKDRYKAFEWSPAGELKALTWARGNGWDSPFGFDMNQDVGRMSIAGDAYSDIGILVQEVE